jgi:hypothetical protein
MMEERHPKDIWNMLVKITQSRSSLHFTLNKSWSAKGEAWGWLGWFWSSMYIVALVSSYGMLHHPWKRGICKQAHQFTPKSKKKYHMIQ